MKTEMKLVTVFQMKERNRNTKCNITEHRHGDNASHFYKQINTQQVTQETLNFFILSLHT